MVRGMGRNRVWRSPSPAENPGHGRRAPNEGEERAFPSLRHPVVGQIGQERMDLVLVGEEADEQEGRRDTLTGLRIPHLSAKKRSHVLHHHERRCKRIRDAGYGQHQEVPAVPRAGVRVVLGAAVASGGAHALARGAGGDEIGRDGPVQPTPAVHNLSPRLPQIAGNTLCIQMVAQRDIKPVLHDLGHDAEPESRRPESNVTRAAVGEQADGGRSDGRGWGSDHGGSVARYHKVRVARFSRAFVYHRHPDP